MSQACRIQHIGVLTREISHAGLVLSRCLQARSTTGEEARDLIEAARKAANRACGIYDLAYKRWVRETRGHAVADLEVLGRLVVGLAIASRG